jgi:predicted NAD/FAD-dependent oxidoreductase
MFFLLSTFAYVMYQLFGGNALLDPQEMVRQATIQKMISLVHIVSIFSLSFGFHQQLELNNSK